MEKPLPKLIAFGWSTDRTSFISGSIRYLTRPGVNPFGRQAEWSHMFLAFQFNDGRSVIHEALMSEGWKQQDGAKLTEWKKKNPRKHFYTVRWLPIGPDRVQEIYLNSCDILGRKSYSMKQIAAFGLAESLFGRWMGLSLKAGPDEVICSEEASRQVWRVCPEWDLRSSPEASFDGLSPQRAYDNFMKLMRKRYADDTDRRP